MSTNIDERIVEMRFDNQHFEKNVSTSMSTLDKLKQKLKLPGATKGFEEVESASEKVRMSVLTKTLDTVQGKFSALEIMGITALTNLTNSAINMGKRLAASLTTDQLTAGWSKYEQKTASVQTIMNATGLSIDQVNRYLDKLMWFSDETSYGFTDMTAALGQMTSSGGDIKNLIPLITGVANATAYAGKGAAEFSRVMYNLNQSYGAGYLQLMDWKSVELAGVGSMQLKQTFIDVAEQLGKIEKGQVTVANFAETLKSKWADTEVMEAAFGRFGEFSDAVREMVASGEVDTAAQAIEKLSGKYGELGEKAFKSAQEAKSFTEAIDATKDAVSSGWLKTYEIIFGNYEEAKVAWTDLANILWDIFASGADARNEMLTEAMSVSNWDRLAKQITDVGISFEDFQEKVKETAKEHGIAIDDIIAEHGSLANAFRKGALNGSLIINTLKKYAGNLTATSKATELATDKIEEFRSQVLKTIRGDFGNGADRIKAFADAGMDYATVQGIVNKVFADGVVNYKKLDECLADLSISQLESMGYTEEQASALKELAEQAEKTGTPLNELINNLTKPTGRELLIESLMNTLTGLKGIIDVIVNAWNKFMGIDSTGIYNLVSMINAFTKKLVITTTVIDENGEEIEQLTKTGDKLRRIFEGLFAVIDLITTITGGAFKFALNLVCELLGVVNIDVLELVAKFGDLLVTFRKFVFENNLVAKGIRAFGSGLVFVITKIEEFIDAMMSIPMVRNAIEKFKMTLIGTYQSGKDFILGFINGIKDGSISIIDLLKNLGAKIIEKFRISLGEHSPSRYTFQAAIDFILGFINGIKEFAKKAFAVIIDFGKKLVEKIQNIDWGTVAAVGISAGLLVLFGLIAKAVYSIMRPFDILKDVLESVGDMFDSVSKTFNAASMVLIAGAIAVLVSSIVSLTKVHPGLVWSSVGAIVALGVTLTGLVIAMNKLTTATDADGNKIKIELTQIALALVGIAAAMLITAGAIKILSSVHWTDALVAVGLFASLVVGMYYAVKSLGKLSTTSHANILSFSVLLLSMSAMLLVFSKTAKQMSKLSPGELLKGIGALAVMVTGLILFSNLVAKDMPQVGSTFVALGATLGLLVFVVKMASKLEAATLIRGMAILVPLEMLMVGLIAITNLFGPNAAKTGGTLLGMAASMLLILRVVKTASKLEVAELGKGIVAIGALSVIIGLLVAITNLYSGDAKGLAITLLAMSASLAVIAAISVLLGLVKEENLLKGVTAMGVLVGMMSLLILATKNASKCKGNLIVLTVALTLMAGAIAALSFIDPTKIIVASASLSLLMGMFALLVKMASVSKGSLITIGIMTLVMGGLGAMLWGLSLLPIQSVLVSAASLSALILALSGACALLSIAGAAAVPALIGIGLLAALVAAVGLLIVGIGALATYWTDMQTFLDVGLPILEKIGYGLGSFFGHIVGGLIGGVSSCLPAIANNLTKFMGNIQGFINGASSISLKAVAGVTALAGMILILTASSIMSGLTSWLTGGSSIVSFANDISHVGSAIAQFASDTDGISADNVESCANAALALAKMASAIPNTGGKLAEWIGDNTLSSFGEELAKFGPNFAIFASSVVDIPTDAIEKSASAATMLADMANKLPNSGGKLAEWMGDNTLSSFGEELVKFGPKIKKYGDSVEGLNDKAVKASASAATILAEMASKLPNSGGYLATWMGDNTLSSFGEELSKFGPSIKKYGDSVANLNTKAVKASANAAESLSKLANGLPNRNGILQDWFGGKTDLGTFGQQLNTLGSSLVSYSAYVSLIDTTKIKDSAKAVNTLSDIAIDISRIQSGWFSTDLTFDDFGKMIKKFGEKLYDYYEKVKNIDVGKLSDISGCVRGLIEAMKTATNYDKWAKVGKYFVEGLASGISEYTYKAEAKAKAMAKAARIAAEKELEIASPSKVTFKDGQWFALGMAKGILDATGEVEESSESLTESALDGLTGPIDDTSAREQMQQRLNNLFDDPTDNPNYSSFLGKVKTAITNAANKTADALETSGKETGTSFTGGLLSTIKDFGEKLSESVMPDSSEIQSEAQDKAEETVDEYKKAFNRLDTKDKRLDLEFELLGGDEAVVYAEKYANQLERINVSQKKYDDMKSKHGDDSDEALEAYNELLQEKIDLNNLVKSEEDRKYQHSIDWIEKKKEAEELSLYDELAAYKRVQARYEEGSENRIKADKEVARVQKEIADANDAYYKEVEQIHEDYTERKKELDKEYQDSVEEMNKQLKADIQSVWDEYESAVDSRAKSIYGSYGLFDEVTAPSEVDGSTLMNNLQSQVDAIEDWKTDIQSLTKRGVNKDLMSELYNMGPSAAANIKALNSLSNTELRKYEKLWREKQSSAREQAKFELVGLRNDSLSEIRKLELESERELDKYRASVGTQLNQLTTDTDKQLKNAKTTWLEALRVNDPEKEEVKSSFTSMVEDITTDISTDNGWSEAGANSINGLIRGITLNAHLLYTTMSETMSNALGIAQSVWAIHSPSREFMKIGKFGVKGLALGFVNNAKFVIEAVKEVGSDAMSSMTDSIAKIVDVINDDVDTQPTIRPVLDLSDVESKTGRLNAMFSREQAMAISHNRSNANRGEIQNGTTSSTNGDTYNFTQNNYSPKALPRREIYRQTKNQFSAVKRMVKA